MSFQDKTVIITGGAKGIGEGCTRVFHRQNANVAVLDVDEDAGEKLSSEMGNRCIFIKCDIANENEVKDAVSKTVDVFGNIDVLINNAGIMKYSTVTTASSQEWDTVMNINVKGAFLCAKYSIPHMKVKGAGVVINMSSVQAFITQENVATYATSKAALIGLTRSIAVDYAPEIRCVAICPAAVDTPLNQKAFQLSPDPEKVIRETEAMHLVQRMAKPEELGEFVAFVASEKGSFLTGQPLRFDGGMGAKSGGPGTD
ncbi:MAG: glucose 1-dehydrogenase [Balneolaceae bacterium]